MLWSCHMLQRVCWRCSDLSVKLNEACAAAGHGEILYQPDSGDDLDSDPDEDLEF